MIIGQSSTILSRDLSGSCMSLTGIGGDAFTLYYEAASKKVLNYFWMYPAKYFLKSFLNTILQKIFFEIYVSCVYAQVHCLLGCGKSPQGLTLEAVKNRGITGMEMPLMHALTVMVPGAASLLEETVKKWGNLTLSEVCSSFHIFLAHFGLQLTILMHCKGF